MTRPRLGLDHTMSTNDVFVSAPRFHARPVPRTVACPHAPRPARGRPVHGCNGSGCLAPTGHHSRRATRDTRRPLRARCRGGHGLSTDARWRARSTCSRCRGSRGRSLASLFLPGRCLDRWPRRCTTDETRILNKEARTVSLESYCVPNISHPPYNPACCYQCPHDRSYFYDLTWRQPDSARCTHDDEQL